MTQNISEVVSRVISYTVSDWLINEISFCSNLGKNELRVLPRKPFEGLTLLRDLTLSHNHLLELLNDTFVGLPELQYL